MHLVMFVYNLQVTATTVPCYRRLNIYKRIFSNVCFSFTGYKTYVGLIMLELYHRNPILLVFCDEMLTFQDNKKSMIELQTPNENVGYQLSVSYSIDRLKRIRARNKWFKAFTLVNNPCLRNMTKGKN
jgi:hypothetical protein